MFVVARHICWGRTASEERSSRREQSQKCFEQKLCRTRCQDRRCMMFTVQRPGKFPLRRVAVKVFVEKILPYI